LAKFSDFSPVATGLFYCEIPKNAHFWRFWPKTGFLRVNPHFGGFSVISGSRDPSRSGGFTSTPAGRAAQGGDPFSGSGDSLRGPEGSELRSGDPRDPGPGGPSRPLRGLGSQIPGTGSREVPAGRGFTSTPRAGALSPGRGRSGSPQGLAPGGAATPSGGRGSLADHGRELIRHLRGASK